MRLLCIAVFCLATSCGDDDEHKAYSNMQECVDEHTTQESLTSMDAIVGCCLDHPIDGQRPACGASGADCRAYLTNSLPGPTATEIAAACDEYIVQKGM